MKLIKGLKRDTHPTDNPSGSWIDGRNKILSKKYQGSINEYGFLRISPNYNIFNNKIPIGVIPVAGSNGKFIVFSILCSIDGTALNSEIGYCDANDNFNYTEVINSSIDVNNDLAFSPEHQISGEAMLNNNDEIICAFTDNFKKPKFINLSDDFSTWDIRKLYLFPETIEADVTGEISEGGNLPSGVYFFICRYKSKDNSYSNYGTVTEPFYIFEDSLSNNYNNISGSLQGGINTSKSIKLSFTNVDTIYSHLCISCIKVENNVTYAYDVVELAIGNSTNIDYLVTGDNFTVTEFLTLNSKYDSYEKIKKFTTINQQLYATNLTKRKEFKYQKYANLITLLVKSTLLEDLEDVNDSSKIHEHNSLKSSLMHDEVYAIYAAPIFKDNTIGNLYHIPGRDVAVISQSTGDNNHIALENEKIANIKTDPNYSNLGLDDSIACDDDTLGSEVRYYQTRNCAIYTGSENILFPSFWENQNETYPDSDEYDSTIDYDGTTDITSLNPSKAIDYRNQKVRHHKMPDITWLKNNLYLSEDNYGYNKLDTLNIIISNLVIPEGYEDIILGFKFYFAKKNPDNSLVLCNDITHYMGQDVALGTNEGTLNTGGNFNINAGGNSINMPLTGIERIKTHNIDLLKNKPAINPSYVKQHLRLFYKYTNILNVTSTDCPVGLVNYFNETAASWGANSKLNYLGTNYNYMVRKITNGQYIPNNAVVNINGIQVNNLNSESGYVFQLNNSNLSNWAVIQGEFGSIGGTNDEDITGSLVLTGAVLYSLMNYKTDVHLGFDKQSDYISFPKLYKLTNLTKANTTLGNKTYYVYKDFDLYGGDTVISDNCYLSYGLKSAINYGDSYYQKGTRVLHRYVAPTRNNSSLRSLTNSTYGNFYPKINTFNWLNGLESQYDPEIGYNNDYTKREDFEGLILVPFNYSIKYINRYPKRIIRTVLKTNTEQYESWKEFLNNDYFELKSNFDEIINIQGLSNGELIIHNQGLYKTRSITRIGTDNKEAVLGTGDLFEFPPQPIMDDTFGNLGTQHTHACKLTPIGYVAVDAKLGIVYLINDGIKILSNEGLRNFFKQYAKTNDSNYSNFYIDDNPITYNGYNIEYDERFNRLLISKKDFVPKQSFINNYGSIFTTNQELIDDPTQWYLINIGSPEKHLFYKSDRELAYIYAVYDGISITRTYIRPNDTTYFDNKSFTLSYSLEYDCWAYFHDYIPDCLFRLRNNILLSLSSESSESAYSDTKIGYSKLFLHNNPLNKGIYYNYELVDNAQLATPYTSFVTPIFNSNMFGIQNPSSPLNNRYLGYILHSILWESYLKETAENNDNFPLIYKTFDRILLWNSLQSSGIVDLIPFDSIAPNPLTDIYNSNVRRKKQKWQFNNFNNLVIDTNNAFIQGGDNGNSYDIVTANIDTVNQKEFFQKSKICDNWTAVKLIYDNKIADDLITQYELLFTNIEMVVLPLKN